MEEKRQKAGPRVFLILTIQNKIVERMEGRTFQISLMNGHIEETVSLQFN